MLQFDAADVDDFDQLVALEDQLLAALQSKGEVDGHDFGSGEMNIFILTNDPIGVFDVARKVVEASGLLDRLRAAHRPVESDTYTVLWPAGLREFSVK